jgi:hypothetical protein
MAPHSTSLLLLLHVAALCCAASAAGSRPGVKIPANILPVNIPTSVAAAVHSNVQADLLGAARTFTKAAAQGAQEHPRVLFDAREFGALVSRHAATATVPGTFAYALTQNTQVYVRNARQNVLRQNLTDDQVARLVTDALPSGYPTEVEAQGFFIQALRAFMYREQLKRKVVCSARDVEVTRCVADARAAAEFMAGTKRMVWNWARFVIKDRAVRGALVNWSVDESRKAGGAGFVLAYDVLYNEFTVQERALVASALALIVKSVKPWGWGKPSTNIWSNWAMYNSNIYLFNCVLEGTPGYNEQLNREYVKILRAGAENSIYESGFTFEDGYTTATALREGSLGLVALARRDYNAIDTPRFRNLLSYAAQSYEPWECSNFIGHSSGDGGGKQYQSFIALARYAFPNGPLAKMLWKGNWGSTHSCSWRMQTALDVSIFGGDHAPDAASSPQALRGAGGSTLALSAYGRERGLLIARSSIKETALFIHLNGRHDAWFPGHDNSDRGTFVLGANRRTWVPDLPWRAFSEADKHSLLFIDGRAQDDSKAPGAAMLHAPVDDGRTVISTLDLTYAYSYRWNAPWATATDNFAAKYPGEGWERETTDPRKFGFPADVADRMGLPTSLYGHADWGFLGLWQWRAPFNPVKYVYRSTALVRDHGGASYFVVADTAEKDDAGEHQYSWEMNLRLDTASGYRTFGDSAIVLASAAAGEQAQALAVHVVTNAGAGVSFEIRDMVDGDGALAAKRLVVRPTRKTRGAMKFVVVLHPFLADGSDKMLTVVASGGGAATVLHGTEAKKFSVPDGGGRVEILSSRRP